LAVYIVGTTEWFGNGCLLIERSRDMLLKHGKTISPKKSLKTGSVERGTVGGGSKMGLVPSVIGIVVLVERRE
jgi:hypothetical protein